MDQLTSLFIDDEMNMDDKISFVRQLKDDPATADAALLLLKQEIHLREDVVTQMPQSAFAAVTTWDRIRTFFVQPKRLVGVSMAVVAAALILALWPPPDALRPNRFVIYRPDVTRAEITGSFTDWQRVPMQAVGSSGYWEIILALPEGEHRFSYILNGQDSFPDPTVLTREQDDFGSQNSVIFVGKTA